MRTKKYTASHMMRITPRQKLKLEEAAERLGINATELSRLAMKAGLPLIERKLSLALEDELEGSHHE